MQKEAFLKKSGIFLGMLYDDFASTPTLPLHSFAKEKTAAVAVDMVNGFVKEGNLSSARILQINDNVAAFCAACIKRRCPFLHLPTAMQRNVRNFLTIPCIACITHLKAN